MPQRRDYIDELKGLGILLVVLGHFIEQYRMGYSFVSASFFCIYAFHMALFCICSGLVARFNPRKLVTQQLWLYLVGQTLMLAFRAAVLRENFAETGGLLAAWLLPWRHIWYLYALIFWHLTLPVLCRLRDRLGLAGSCLGMALAVGLALAAGLVDWPFTLVRVFAFYPFYACGVLLRPQLDRLAAFATEHRPVRLVAAAGLVLGYGAYFLWVLRADPIMDHSAELFHDVSYAGGDRVQYRVVFYLVGIATTAGADCAGQPSASAGRAGAAHAGDLSAASAGAGAAGRAGSVRPYAREGDDCRCALVRAAGCGDAGRAEP